MLFFALANCPICSLSSARLWIEWEHAVASAATDPIIDGHIVVAPRKHVSTVYELSPREQHALWALVSEVRSRLLTGFTPDTLRIGFK
jgi:diadenosine tetraphosphate (Ap4A) HIT family hydrolase